MIRGRLFSFMVFKIAVRPAKSPPSPPSSASAAVHSLDPKRERVYIMCSRAQRGSPAPASQPVFEETSFQCRAVYITNHLKLLLFYFTLEFIKRANIWDLLPRQKSFLKNKENKWIYNLNPEVTYFNKFWRYSVISYVCQYFLSTVYFPSTQNCMKTI